MSKFAHFSPKIAFLESAISFSKSTTPTPSMWSIRWPWMRSKIPARWSAWYVPSTQPSIPYKIFQLVKRPKPIQPRIIHHTTSDGYRGTSSQHASPGSTGFPSYTPTTPQPTLAPQPTLSSHSPIQIPIPVQRTPPEIQRLEQMPGVRKLELYKVGIGEKWFEKYKITGGAKNIPIFNFCPKAFEDVLVGFGANRHL